MSKYPVAKQQKKLDAGETYGGILAEPMPKWTALTMPPEDQIGELIDSRMIALFEHFGLDAKSAYEAGPLQVKAWADLAFALARAHVPGFQSVPRSQGRPPKRRDDDITLFLWVELFKRRDGLNQTAAIRLIAKNVLVAGTYGTLKKRYEHSKKQLTMLATMTDRMSDLIGHDKLIEFLEQSLGT